MASPVLMAIVRANFVLSPSRCARGREHNSYWSTMLVDERLPLELKIIAHNGGVEFGVNVKRDNEYIWHRVLECLHVSVSRIPQTSKPPKADLALVVCH